MTSVPMTVTTTELSVSPAPDWFQPLLDYWGSKRSPGRRLPSRADIDPIDLKPMLGWLSLIDVAPSPPRFKLRLLGGSQPPRTGGPRHGRDLDSIEPAVYRAVVEAQYELVLARCRPLLHENILAFDQYRLQYQRMALPLGRDYETPDMLMIATRVDTAQHRRFFSAYDRAVADA